MTQAQLAGKLGVQYQTVSKWETDTSDPDAAMLPKLADALGASIDQLFGRRNTGCSGKIPSDQAAFLLQTYSQMYAAEAGPWNLSVENKYLEYRFRAFFEEHFTVSENTQICNIGIGAGEWDTYLAYKLRGGRLTSIDKLEICCRQLEQRLLWEGNPNEVRVICGDAMALELTEQFDIVTVVGSTAQESGASLALLATVFRFVKRGGAVYYQTLHRGADCNAVISAALRQSMMLGAYAQDDAYGFDCRYYMFVKE